MFFCQGHWLRRLYFTFRAWMLTLGIERVSIGMTWGMFVGSCGELMGVEGMYPPSFLIRLSTRRDNCVETIIRTGAAVNGRGVTDMGRSGGGVVFGRESLLIFWKMAPSLSMASIAEPSKLEKGKYVIGFVRA